MAAQRYTARQRRALNQVWDGAGEYGFDPPFLARRADGSPDLYMNAIVGCTRKWYGEEGPAALFAAWAGDVRQTTLDELAWLALEDAAYTRELPERPVLEELRRDHAQAFFAQEYQLSRQEWMAKNQLAYTLQAARWRAVLGKRTLTLTPGERALLDGLTGLGKLDAEGLNAAVLAALARARLFDGRARAPRGLRLRLTGKWAEAAAKLLPTEIVHTDVLTVGRSLAAGQGGGGTELDLKKAVFKLNENAETDRAYIESCFGRSLYPPEALAAMERRLCTGRHFGCRLWVAAGVPDPERAKSGDARLLALQAGEQAEKNRADFRREAQLYNGSIHRLAEQVLNCIQVHARTECITARSGRLDCSRVWRAAVLEDERVFLRDSDTSVPAFSVDLLLDASASRLHCQEVIAAQGYILSESLSRCGVAVRVSSFCSLRGYTVLRILKDYQDKSSRGVFHYFAAGWNRDGLALRCAGELMSSAPAPQRLLLILTDASPNDIHRIAPSPGDPFGRDYDGPPAVKDAAEEVRVLRRAGVRVGAVFMGEDSSAANASLIYGRSLARIRSMDQLARAAGRLIQDEICQMPL